MSHEFKKENKILKIHSDPFPESPREWDNLGTMVYGHRKYCLGDKQARNLEHYTDWDNWFEGEIGSKNAIALPLYLYDHSGLVINTTPFSCPWDSGQVGWIYAKKENIRKEYNKKRVSKKMAEKVKEVLRGEVEVFNDYIRGNIYGYTLNDISGKEIDSCWGFYGNDFINNGILDCVGEEWRELIA